MGNIYWLSRRFVYCGLQAAIERLYIAQQTLVSLGNPHVSLATGVVFQSAITDLIKVMRMSLHYFSSLISKYFIDLLLFISIVIGLHLVSAFEVAANYDSWGGNIMISSNYGVTWKDITPPSGDFWFFAAISGDTKHV